MGIAAGPLHATGTTLDHRRFCQVLLPGSRAWLAEAYALISTGTFGSYLCYDDGDTRWLAGDVLGEILVHEDRLAWRVEGTAQEAPLGPRPIAQIGELLGTWPMRGRRSFGYLAFELAHRWQAQDSAGPAGWPLAHLIVPAVEVCWSSTATVVTGHDAQQVSAVADVLRAGQEPPRPTARYLDTSPPLARKRYESMVSQVLAAIHRGDLHKAVVSRRLEVPFALDLPGSYVLGLGQNTPARSFLLDLAGRQCAGFSPETVVEVDRDGRVRTQPLAGTRPLLNLPERDVQLHRELTWNVKECYEHAISARLSSEEMHTVCDPSSVAVRDLMTVKRRGSVQHLASAVTGRLAAGRTPWDALEALWPAVTASGIPKRPALELIRETEGGRRGLYAGAVCTAGGDGSLDVALVLRSIFQDRGGAWLRAGAGVVAGSHPAHEYDETTAKLRSVAGCLVARTAAPGSAGQPR